MFGRRKERIEFEKEKDEEIIPTQKEEGDPFCERGMEIPRKEERPRIKRREKDAPWKLQWIRVGIFSTKYVEIDHGKYKRSALGGFRGFRKARGCKIVWAIT